MHSQKPNEAIVDLDTLALEPSTPGPLATLTRSPDDPNEILLDDEEASVIVGDDDFLSLLNEEKGDEELEHDEQ